MTSPIKLSFSLFFILFAVVTAQNSNQFTTTTHDIPVGVILDLNTIVGKIGQTSIQMAMKDFYTANKNYSTRLVLHTRDSNGDDFQAISAGNKLLLIY
jgi:glutamate receptor, ionotropic, plant